MGNRRLGPLAPIKHGTTWGYQQHLQTDRLPCDDCRAAYSDHQTALRLRHGQPTLQVPAQVIGSLLLALDNATREYAVAALGPLTAAECVLRAASRAVQRE
ncbi:MAG TPA: hypothetical protein VJ914_40325 [Pseudonocardiaceae bacterium]|nr:hypothetical protein [Pseudonocardiaceae bacterium]